LPVCAWRNPDANIQTPDWLRQMENILEELNEGVAIVDNQLRVIFVNEALTRLGQYEREEIQGHTPDAIFPPEDMPYVLRQHESALRYGVATSSTFHAKDRQKVPVIPAGG
jgi:PAS domain S-box-containing protein